MLNLVELLYLCLGLTTVLLGSLVNYLEPYLPTFVAKTFRYGKFASEKDCSLTRRLEIPKSKFKHFYAFALIWGAGGFYLGICAYITGRPLPGFIHSLLDLLVGSERHLKSECNKSRYPFNCGHSIYQPFPVHFSR